MTEFGLSRNLSGANSSQNARLEIAVHIGVREEDFRGAALDDYVEDV
jgi:hypothetical protein